ncbi:MAG TPA: glycine betaine ABC transporter substrate-binding protein [Cellulomonas sp.]|nr:glycine betaine ABC transporter substrate-binding protein [Cellulomonas sp.]
MRTPPIAATAAALATAGVLLLAACGAPGSGGGVAATTAASASGAAACAPVTGDKLVVLTDDKGLQNADNVIPAVNAAAAAADPALVPLLDTVSASLDTTKLIGLNKSVDIDRKTSTEVAAAYVKDAGLTASDASVGAGRHVVVGAANFSESATLSEVYAAVLRSAGYTADVQTIGNRETYLPALESGQITATPEYAATLAEFLNTKVNSADASPVASSDVDSTVTALTTLGNGVGLTFGTASAAQDQNAFAVTSEFAQEHGVTTLSELAAACGSLVLAGPAECPQRPFCQPGLESKYGLTFSDFKSYDFGLIGDAVRHGEAAIGLVLSSDGSLAS